MDWTSITAPATPTPPSAYLREHARLQLAALKPERDRLTALAATLGDDSDGTVQDAIAELDARAELLAAQAAGG